METKGVVVLLCWSVLVSLVFMGCITATRDDETWQEVRTSDGATVLFGNTYTITAPEIGVAYLFRFIFGLGGRGQAVRTDTTVTLGRNGDESRVYACVNGRLQLISVDPSGTPHNAIIRVRYNSTDGYYRLQITEDSPAVFVQFTWLSQGGLLCSTGVPGSPIRFGPPPSSSSSSRDDLHELPTIALRQEVDG